MNGEERSLVAALLPGPAARKIPRSIHEGSCDIARDLSLTDAYPISRRGGRTAWVPPMRLNYRAPYGRTMRRKPSR